MSSKVTLKPEGTPERSPSLARVIALTVRILKAITIPFMGGAAWAAWSNWGAEDIDWRKVLSAFGSAFFFVAYFMNFFTRASSQQDAEDRHALIMTNFHALRSAFPVSGTVNTTLAPATSAGEATTAAPATRTSTQADLVHESQRALEAGLVRSSLMTLGTALEIAAARAVERIGGGPNERYLGLMRAIEALGTRLTPEHRIALDRLRRIRNELSHEARFDFTAEQVRDLNEAFRRAIVLLDAIER